MLKLEKIRKKITVPKVLYMVFVFTVILSIMTTTVFAEDVWDKANEILTDVYNHILIISTIAGVVTASIALLMMNFSKSVSLPMNPTRRTSRPFSPDILKIQN